MMCIKLCLVLLLVSVLAVQAKKDKKCPLLTAPENGEIKCVRGNSLSPNSVFLKNCKEANFTCNQGYELIGDETLTCLKDSGEWSAPVPTCINELWQCDFECNTNDNLCGMEQPTTDDFDWTLKSGGTSSFQTGPSSAINGTYYIYIETSSPRQNGDVALFYSPPLTLYTGPACIKFYRHMYGSTIRTLSVHIRRNGQNGNALWTQSGDQGNQWDEISITADLQVGDQIVFRGERGTSFTGDIALDNIRIKVLSCGSEA